MPQFTPRSDGMNVRELVALGRYPWHGMLGRFTSEDAGKVEDAIRRTGLEPLAHRIVDSLSGGERQRAWLALMLAQDTQLPAARRADLGARHRPRDRHAGPGPRARP